MVSIFTHEWLNGAQWSREFDSSEAANWRATTHKWDNPKTLSCQDWALQLALIRAARLRPFTFGAHDRVPLRDQGDGRNEEDHE